MPASIRYLPILALAVVSLAASAADYKPAPASIVRHSGERMDDVYILQDNMDGVRYASDSEGRSQGGLKRSEIAEIDYQFNAVDSPTYLRGLGQMSDARQDWAGAVKSLSEAVDKVKFEWVAINSYALLTEAHVNLEQYDKAVETIDTFLKLFPKAWRVIELWNRRGEILLMAGKGGEARASWQALLDKADDFSALYEPLEDKTRGLARFGLARAARTVNDYKAMVEHLTKAVTIVDVNKRPQLYGQAGLDLAFAQQKTGDVDGALQTYRGLRYQPISGAMQARAHLGVAEILADQGKLYPAFDHALIACVRKGTTVSTEAKTLVRSLFAKIEKDPKLSLDDKRQYKDYVNKL